MSEIGRWVATWDRVTSRKKSTVVFPGWRVAWECDGFENIWTEMTFGRAEDAARAVRALYSLNDWQCASTEEVCVTAKRITRAKMRQTILEAMAMACACARLARQALPGAWARHLCEPKRSGLPGSSMERDRVI